MSVQRKEMCLLMVLVPRGELHVGFPPTVQEGISKGIVIAAALW